MNGKEETFLVCTDTSDCIELSFTSGLYLKPITKLSITVTIPHLKSGQAIANKEIIEKLKIAIRPEKFTSIVATKNNLEFLRFDAELDNKKKSEFVISKIDQKGIKLAGFNEVLKIRATEGKISFPSRHDWNSYFKEAKHMNEKKPGERPDTVHIKDIPCEWFIHNDDPTGACPSEYVVSKVFSSFGEIRALDIPYLDPYRKQMSAVISGVNKFSFSEGRLFDVYVQYKEYIGFAKCMHTLQAKKLVIQRDETVYMANIRVDFDKTKHLSDGSMKRREVEREKIMSTSIHLQEKSRMKKEIYAMKKDAEILEKYNAEEKERKRVEEKADKKKGKEEKRKQKEIKTRLKKLMAKHKDLTDIEDVEGKLTKKVAIEEHKLTAAQRSVEAIRLFDKIFDRIKTYHQKETAIKTTWHSSGIQSEPVLFGNWFSVHCQTLMKKKKALYEQFVNVKSNENWLHYKKCSHKLKKASHNQKLKFIGSCLKNAKGSSNKELDERRRKELISCKKIIKLSKARQLDHVQIQQKRVEKVMRGKIQVIFLPCDDENKVALSPASSGNSSSSSASSLSDDSDSDKEKKNLAGKMRSDQLEGQDMYGNPGNMDRFQGGNFYYNNYRPRMSYGMGQPFPYDNRGRGFRFFRPYFNRGFRGGPHQGFDNRGRGFYQFRGRFPYDKSRGRGGYFDNKKVNEHPIQLGTEKWFKRGNEEENEEESYYKQKYLKNQKSEHWSPSWSDSRSRSRSPSRKRSRSGSRKRSRSWSRSRSKSYSRSRSGSERRRSCDKSPRYSKNEGQRRYSRRSSSSESRSRSRDRQRRSVDSARSNSVEITNRRKSNKDRSRSRSSGSSGARSFEDRYRKSRSKSRNRYSDRSYSRSLSPRKYRKHHKRDRTLSRTYDDYPREYYSDEFSEEERNVYGNSQEYYNDKFINRRHSSDFRGRGRGSRQFYNYRGNPRQRRPRGGSWRVRGRGHFNNYNQNEQNEEFNEQYLNLYKKYFKRVAGNDSYKRDSSSSEDSYRERKSTKKTKVVVKDDTMSDDSEKKVPVKKKAKYGSEKRDRKKEQIDDMNARYREEEERARADKIQQSKVPVKKRSNKNIRERLDDSDDGAVMKKKRRKTCSISDEDSLYGPLPPKHIQSRSHRK